MSATHTYLGTNNRDDVYSFQEGSHGQQMDEEFDRQWVNSNPRPSYWNTDVNCLLTTYQPASAASLSLWLFDRDLFWCIVCCHKKEGNAYHCCYRARKLRLSLFLHGFFEQPPVIRQLTSWISDGKVTSSTHFMVVHLPHSVSFQRSRLPSKVIVHLNNK